ncbi:MAG: acyltransferase [Alistipes sp.]
MSSIIDKWDGKSRGGYTGYIIFIFLIRYIGLRAAYILLGFVVIYFIPFAPKATAAIWDYYRRTLHKGCIASGIGLIKHYYRFGQTIIDRVAVENGLGKKFRYEFEGYEQALQLFERQQGFVMIGAHFGAPAIGAEHFGKYAEKINLVMYDAEHRRVKEALNRVGQRMELRIIPIGNDPLSSILYIKTALDHNECVSFMGDRYLSTMRLFEVDFLERRARFPQGPFLLAERMQVPVLFYFATRERHRTYRFRFNVLEPYTTGRRDGNRCFAAFLPLLEKEVRRHNAQWFNFYKFWN